MPKKLTWAVIGGGNGGHAAAGQLGISNQEVKLYDISKETVDAIQSQGGINVSGVLEGFGKVALASTDMSEILDGVDVIMVVVPSIYHKQLAKKIAPYIKENQILFIHPGATFGAIEFYNELKNAVKIPENFIICEALSLLYACRITKIGSVKIVGFKNELKVASIPANKTDYTVSILNSVFPQITAAKNVLETSLSNLNALMHPAPSVLNTSMIESKHDWEYYNDGITPSIGKFIEKIDEERIAIGKKLGLDLIPVKSLYKKIYDTTGETLTEIVRSNSAYKGIMGQKQLNTRYILEDIPTGLVPMCSLGKYLGVDTTAMDTICTLANLLVDEDVLSSGRTIENLGLDNLSPTELIRYVETGVREE